MSQLPAAMSSQSAHESAPAGMLIAGAGVAGLETPLALRGLAGGRVEVTILAPELKFVSRGMSVVAQPSIPSTGVA